jgi:hypothetical protein
MIEDDEMPFVNRQAELWQIFSVNAQNHDIILNTKGPIKNFRLLRLLFCVQVFSILRPHLCSLMSLTSSHNAV